MRAATLAGVLLLGASAWALALAGDCEFSKLRAAGEYFACGLSAERIDSRAPDASRCDARLSTKWRRAETKGRGRCPSINDQMAIRDFITQCTEGVATALAGGALPACVDTPASVPSSTADQSAPSQCEDIKLKTARKYSACWLRATGRALRARSGAPDVSKCEARFAAKWVRAETKRGPCPSSNDQTEIQILLTRCTEGLVTALAGGLLPTCSAPVDEWPVGNHDHQNSRANEAERTIAPDNVGQLVPRWRVDGLSGVTSTPAVVDGVVYFGDWSGRFHAIRTSDGTEIWSQQAGSPIRPSPLVAGDRVYIPESNGRLYALHRLTGDVLWTAPIDTQPFVSMDSSPVLAGNTIVIGVESFEQVIRKPDYTFRGNIVGLDADTGAERWRVYTAENDATAGAGASVWSSAAVDEARKLVFIGSGQAYEQPAGPRTDSLIAIRYETGEVAWVHQFTTGDVFTVAGGGPGSDADVGASPNLFAIGSRDVVGVGQKNGFYHVLDRDTGETVWEVQLTAGSPLGGVMVTAAVHDGVIYVNSNKWRAFGFVTTGMHSPLDTSSTFALDARDGTILWETPMPAPMFGAMTYANGVVYQGTIEGTVHALSAEDGTELWSDKPGGDIAGGFSVVGGSLYAGRGFWFFTRPPAPNGGLVAYAVATSWVRTASGGSSQIVYGADLDGGGNTVVCGTFLTSITLGATTFTNFGSGSGDVFVAKYGPTGTFLWARQLGSMTDDVCQAVAVDGSGNVLVTGGFTGTMNTTAGSLVSAGGSDIYVVKLDTNGAHVWSAAFGGTQNDRGQGIGVDSSGNAYVTGFFSGTVNFGGGNRTAPFSTDLDSFILKLAALNGTYILDKTFPNNADEQGFGIAVESGGDHTIVGKFAGDVNFTGGTATGPGSLHATSVPTPRGGTDGFIAKFTSTGSHVWSKNFGSDRNDAAFAVALDSSGNVHVTGSIRGRVDFGGGALAGNEFGDDAFLVKYAAANGALTWAKRIGGGTGSQAQDDGKGVAVDSSGNVILTGSFATTCDFGGTSKTSFGNADAYLAKYTSSGALSAVERWGGTGDDRGLAATASSAGSWAAGGWFRGTASIAGTSLTANPLDGSVDAYVVRRAP